MAGARAWFRARGSEHPRFACGPLSYDSASKQFTLAHETLNLTPREHAALRALIQLSGEPLSKPEILERVFSDEQDVGPEAIEVLVHRHLDDGGRHQGHRGSIRTQVARHVNSCFFTMVAVDDDRRPVPVPALRPFSPYERRRHAAAIVRKAMRIERERRFKAIEAEQ